MNAIAEMNTDGQSANAYSFTPESLAAYVEHHVAARLAAVEAVLTRMECRSVDHRHPNETGHGGVEGRAYYYAGDVIDDIYELRAAVAADPADTADRSTV